MLFNIEGYVNNFVVICTKPHNTIPKLNPLSSKMYELNFSKTDVTFNSALEILNLLFISKTFDYVELVISTQQGLFKYIPKTDVIPSALRKLGDCAYASFSIYIYTREGVL